MAGNLDKECFGHKETLQAISERNPLISTKTFRSKVSANQQPEKGRKFLETGTIFDFFNEEEVEMQMASNSTSAPSSPSKDSPEKFDSAASSFASASSAGAGAASYNPLDVLNAALFQLENFALDGCAEVTAEVAGVQRRGRARSDSQRQGAADSATAALVVTASDSLETVVEAGSTPVSPTGFGIASGNEANKGKEG